MSALLFLNTNYHELTRIMEVKVRVKKADLEKCKTQLDVIELVSGEWLKQHPFKKNNTNHHELWR